MPNPAHQRAKLLRPTDEGYAAVRRIDPGQAAMAERLATALGRRQLERTLDALRRPSEGLDDLNDERQISTTS